MSAFAGTGALVRLILRRDRVILPIWIALLALVVVGVAGSFVSLYPTAESRSALTATIIGNPTFSAILGPLFGSSIGALTAWRIGTIIAALVGLMSLITVIRHTRTEEETGRRELLGATVVGRNAPLSAAVLVTLAANLALAAIVGVGLSFLGLPASGSVTLGLSLAATGFTFASLASVLAQLTTGAGSARGLGIATLGATFLLRSLGDSSGENGAIAWLSYLSPIGWAQQTRPFAGERWELFALFVATTAVLAAAGFALSARRDIGAGLLPHRLGPATASARLSTPLALAWRLQSRTLLAWAAAFIAMGLVFGSVANSVSDILKTSAELAAMLARLGGNAVLVDVMLSAVMGIAGLVAAAYGAQAALRLRSEEEDKRAEMVLATSVSRFELMTSHLVFAAIGPALLLVLTGLATGITYGLSAGDVNREIPRALSAALVQLPAAGIVVGFTLALVGLRPRLTGLVWAVLVLCLLLGQLGQLLQLPELLLNLSPFSHVPRVLLGEPAGAPLGLLAAIAAALGFSGFLGFGRRDIGRA